VLVFVAFEKSDDEKSCFSSTETSPRARNSKKRKKTKTRAPHEATGSDAF
jgi:hypothetical protein